jgi:hypothetical protein
MKSKRKKQSNLKDYMGLVVALLVLCVFVGNMGYIIYESEFKYRNPSYQVGECYSELKKARESWEKDQINIVRIEYVGNENYGYRNWIEDYNIYAQSVHTASFRLIEKYNNTKVDCPVEVNIFEFKCNKKSCKK